jgi:hypothetical protein
MSFASRQNNKMTQNILNTLLLLVTLVSSAPAFGEIVIDFGGLTLNDGDLIPQNYGNNSLFNVSYRELDSFGNGTVVASDLSFWSGGYGDLEKVVWGSDLDTSRVAEVRFDSLSANPIVLNSFDAADWNGSANSQTFRVYDENYSLLFELANFDVTDATHDTITPNTSADTLILQWDYPWAVAVDNISITAVPEPSSLAMLGVGSAFYVFRRRRKNRESVGTSC